MSHIMLDEGNKARTGQWQIGGWFYTCSVTLIYNPHGFMGLLVFDENLA